MSETHVISALVRKRAELLGEVEYYESLLKSHKENLLTIDKTIHIFDESYKISSIKKIKRVKTNFFQRGRLRSIVIAHLKSTPTPLRTDTLAVNIAIKEGIDISNPNTQISFQKTVLSTLKKLEQSNLVETIGKEGFSLLWQIKPM